VRNVIAAFDVCAIYAIHPCFENTHAFHVFVYGSHVDDSLTTSYPPMHNVCLLRIMMMMHRSKRSAWHPAAASLSTTQAAGAQEIPPTQTVTTISTLGAWWVKIYSPLRRVD
jgi:hypothetical protein